MESGVSSLLQSHLDSLTCPWKSRSDDQLFPLHRRHRRSLALRRIRVFWIRSDFQLYVVILVELWKRPAFRSFERVQKLLNLRRDFPSARSRRVSRILLVEIDIARDTIPSRVVELSYVWLI
jgi:hypothetical protein